MIKAEFIKKFFEIEKEHNPSNWVADIIIAECEEVINNGKEKESRKDWHN